MYSVAEKANSRVTIPSNTEDKYNLSPVQLPDLAAFGTASLPRPAGQGSLQIGRGREALPASRLNGQCREIVPEGDHSCDTRISASGI